MRKIREGEFHLVSLILWELNTCQISLGAPLIANCRSILSWKQKFRNSTDILSTVLYIAHLYCKLNNLRYNMPEKRKTIVYFINWLKRRDTENSTYNLAFKSISILAEKCSLLIHVRVSIWTGFFCSLSAYGRINDRNLSGVN